MNKDFYISAGNKSSQLALLEARQTIESVLAVQFLFKTTLRLQCIATSWGDSSVTLASLGGQCQWPANP